MRAGLGDLPENESPVNLRVLNPGLGRFSRSRQRCTMAVLVLEEHGGVCSHWQVVTSKEEEGQSKAKYPLQLFFLNSPPEGAKSVYMLRREERQGIDRPWLDNWKDSGLHRLLPRSVKETFIKGKGTGLRTKTAEEIIESSRTSGRVPPGPFSVVQMCTCLQITHHRDVSESSPFQGSPGTKGVFIPHRVYQGGRFIPHWSRG